MSYWRSDSDTQLSPQEVGDLQASFQDVNDRDWSAYYCERCDKPEDMHVLRFGNWSVSS